MISSSASLCTPKLSDTQGGCIIQNIGISTEAETCGAADHWKAQAPDTHANSLSCTAPHLAPVQCTPRAFVCGFQRRGLIGWRPCDVRRGRVLGAGWVSVTEGDRHTRYVRLSCGEYIMRRWQDKQLTWLWQRVKRCTSSPKEYTG